jgi:hypothetical protein
MDENEKRAASSNVPDDDVHARHPELDALDRHAEERDHLFIWALQQRR